MKPSTLAHSNIYSIKKFNEEEMQALCMYRKDKYPSVESQSRSQDFTVACNLISDLRALGLTNASIAKCRTRLTKLICEYVDEGPLAQSGEILQKEHHENGSRHCETLQSPTTHEHTAENRHEDTPVSTRPQKQHLNGRQVSESAEILATTSISVSRILKATTARPRLATYANSTRKRHKTGNGMSAPTYLLSAALR
jgi:hypothetical protein